MAADQRKKAHVLLAVAGLILVSIFGLKVWSDTREPPSKDDGCMKSVDGKTVIVLDHSQAVAQQTKDEIVARVLNFVDSNEKVHVGDRVSVFTVSQLSKEKLVPIFAYCKQKAEANQLIEKRRLVEDRYRKFRTDLKNVVSAEIADSTETPLAQAIIDLSLSEFLNGAQRSNLLIFSDMIEHTKGFSMYRGRSKDECIRDYKGSRKGRAETPTFKKVDIELGLIPRSDFKGDGQIKCRDGFWPWFFRDNQGGSISPKPLPGN
jgi:hypothetical protein